MRHGFSVYTGGLCLSIAAPDEQLLEQVGTAICLPGWRRACWQPGEIDIQIEWLNGELCARHSGSLIRANNFDDLLGRLEQLCHHELATRSSDIYVHAGVVGLDGRALVIPGRSWTGKSTLVMALVSAGAAYYSDEFAVIYPDGSLAAFARPLSLRHPVPGRVVLTRHSPPPLPKLQVAQLRYDAALGWKVRPLSPGRAVLALLDNTVAARRLGSSASATFAQGLWEGEHWTGTRDEATESAARLMA